MSAKNDIEWSNIRSETVLPRSALVLSKNEYRRVAESIYEKPENERKVLIDMEYEEYLKNGSREMVSKWDNTLEKIRQRKVAALKKKEEQKKAEGLK